MATRRYVLYWSLVALGLLTLCSPVPGDAGCIGCQSPRRATNPVYVTPTGSDNLPATGAAASAITTAGLVRCARVTMQVTKAATALYWRIAVAAAGQTAAVAIYNATGTTLIAASPESTSAASAANLSATGLTAFTLMEGTPYLACFANSGTTVQFLGTNGPTNNVGPVNTVVDGQNAVANKAQFNADCTASATPYPNCTGSTTGTCTGMPASLGTLAAPGSSTFAWIIIN